MHKLKPLLNIILNPKFTDTLVIFSVISYPFIAHSSQWSLALLAIAAIPAALHSLYKKTPRLTLLSVLYMTLVIAYTVSSFQSANFLESYMIPESPFFYLSLVSLYYLWSKSSPNIKTLFQTLSVVLIFDALASLVLLATSKFNLTTPNLPILSATALDWLYLDLLLCFSIYFLFEKQRLFIIPLALLGLTQINALKTQDLGLGLNDSYTYMIDELKSPQRLLLGTSPSRFSNFFGNHFGGIETEVSTLPSHSQSVLLTLLSTVGVLGTLGILSIYVYIYRNITKNIDTNNKLTKYIKALYLSTGLASIFLPLSTNSIIAFHIVTIYLTTHLNESILNFKLVRLPTPKIHPTVQNIVKSILVFPLLFLAFWQIRSAIADHHLYKYNQQAKKGQSLFAYNSIRSAISTYPYRADLHTQYSLVNLVLAEKLTSEGISGDQDQSNILGLYQQAIREATTATTLESGNYIYWKNLGIIYRELITVASNSYTFAEAAYTNAVKIAPQNPALWLDLGVVYFKAGLFDRSCEVTGKALELRSDWYQAHANLGLCLNKLGQTSLAKTHLETALSLTQPDSPEYQKISEDLKQF